jgi:multidrug transporter EmrE-like cation transporter
MRILIQLAWALGILSIVAAFVVKFAHLEVRLNVTGRTLVLLAGAFFLCALATKAMQKPA